jgi:hypothetical protein
VRLRLAIARDEPQIEGLLTSAAFTSPALIAARLARSDPRRRAVICAHGLIGTTETLLGVGEIELRGGAPVAPSLLVVDEDRTEGLAELLRDALTARAAAISRARAA